MSQTYKGFKIESDINNDRLKASFLQDGHSIEILAETIIEIKKKIDKHWKTSFEKTEVYKEGYEGDFELITLTSFNINEGSFYSTDKRGNKSKICSYENRELFVKNKDNLAKLKKIKSYYSEMRKLGLGAEKIEKTLERFKAPAKIEDED